MCPLCSKFPDSRGHAEANVLGIDCLPGMGRVYLDESWDGSLPSMGTRDRGRTGMAEAVMLICNE